MKRMIAVFMVLFSVWVVNAQSPSSDALIAPKASGALSSGVASTQIPPIPQDQIFSVSEKQMLRLEHAVGKVSSHTGFWKDKMYADVPGAKSPIRAQRRQEFLVRTETDIDPAAKYRLIRLVTKRDMRRAVVISSSGLFAPKATPDSVPFVAEKVSSDTYKLKVPVDLKPGEYAFIIPFSNDLFCFGVD